MNDLLSIKDWLSMDEAVTYFCNKLNPEINRSDLISLVRDGKLKLIARVPGATTIEVTMVDLVPPNKKKSAKLKGQIATKFIHLNFLNAESGFKFLNELNNLGYGSAYGDSGTHELNIPSSLVKKEKPIEIIDSSSFSKDYLRFKKMYDIDTELNTEFAEKENEFYCLLKEHKIYGLIQVYYKGTKDDYGFFREDLDILIKALNPEKDPLDLLKEKNESLTAKIKSLEEKLKIEVDKNKILQNKSPKKWRSAFEYQSEGLNALYDLIEKSFFDSDGNPIYDIKELPMKKELESDWLTGRTLAEADTIITSKKRKGVNDK